MLFPEKKSSICIITEGELFTGGNKFKKGDSFYIPPAKDGESLSFSGKYTLFAAIEGDG
jgi:hypothetical protein